MKTKMQRRTSLIIRTISEVVVFCRSAQSSESVSERLNAWIGPPLLSRGGLIAALTEWIDEEWGQDSMLPAQGNRASQISRWYYSTLLANMLQTGSVQTKYIWSVCIWINNNNKKIGSTLLFWSFPLAFTSCISIYISIYLGHNDLKYEYKIMQKKKRM